MTTSTAIFYYLLFLLFCSMTIANLSAQKTDTVLLFNQIYINGVPVEQAPAFLTRIGYTFKLTEYEEEDLEMVDKYYYYKSDSLDITFESYEGIISLSNITVKCFDCSISCGGSDLALGSSVTEVSDNYQDLFLAYANNYYPEILEKEGIAGIPDFAIDFQVVHPQKEALPNGILLFRFEEMKVKEIILRFVAE